MSAYEVYSKSANSSAIYRVYADGRVETWTRDGRLRLLDSVTAVELVAAVQAGLLFLQGPKS